MKRQATDWEKIFSKDIYGKELLSKIYKEHSKQIIDLNVKCKTIKFLVDNIGENLDDFGYHDAFLDTTPKE